MIGVWVAAGLTIVWCGAASADARPEVPSVATVPRTARLYYQKAGASGCPEVEVIHRAVSDRLGYDPFAEIAPITILVAITVGPDVLRARISVIDSSGDEHGQREVVTPSHDCDELAATVGLIVSLTIPMMIAREEMEAQRLALQAALDAAIHSGWMPLPSPAADDRPVTVASPTARRRFHVVVGATASAGAVPGVAPGAKLGIGLRRRSTSFALELGADFGRATQVGDGEVAAARYRALLAGCRATGALEVCLLVAGGATRAQGFGFDVEETTTTPYAALGVRAALERALPRGFSFVIHTDVETAVVGTSLRVFGTESDEWQWIAPAVTATVGLTVRMELP